MEPKTNTGRITEHATKTTWLTPVEFITRHPELIGLAADQLDDCLRERLAVTPITYHSLQDGITLLRGLLIRPSIGVDGHYALLLRENDIIGLVCVNLNDDLPGEPAVEVLTAEHIDSRYLMSRLLDVDATGLLLASSYQVQQPAPDRDEQLFIDSLPGILKLVDVDLVDWLILTDEGCSSRYSETSQIPDSLQPDQSTVLLIEALVDDQPQNEPLPTETTRIKIQQIVNGYCRAKSIGQQQVWLGVYERLYYLYQVSIRSYKRSDRESWLDVAKRNDHMEKIYVILTYDL